LPHERSCDKGPWRAFNVKERIWAPKQESFVPYAEKLIASKTAKGYRETAAC
jgi:hypothetical protein